MENKSKEPGAKDTKPGAGAQRLSDMTTLQKTRKELDVLPTEKVEQAMAFTEQKYYDGGATIIKITSL